MGSPEKVQVTGYRVQEVLAARAEALRAYSKAKPNSGAFALFHSSQLQA
jgi:hypothetical protein